MVNIDDARVISNDSDDSCRHEERSTRDKIESVVIPQLGLLERIPQIDTGVAELHSKLYSLNRGKLYVRGHKALPDLLTSMNNR